jgi:hypothetical protein
MRDYQICSGRPPRLAIQLIGFSALLLVKPGSIWLKPLPEFVSRGDVYSIADLPGNVTAAAASAAVTAGGAAKVTTVVLIRPEEMDEVGKKNVQVYVPPRV